MSVGKSSHVATLLHQLTLATQARRQEDSHLGVASAPVIEDADTDGVPDATEAFLGTCTFTDETHVGHGDDGYIRTPRREPVQTSALFRDPEGDRRIHKENALSLRLAVLQQS